MQTHTPLFLTRVMRPLLLAFLALAALPATAATYVLTVPNYNASYLGPAPSAPYTTAMKVTGSFTTATPLPANMPLTAIATNGSNLVTAWSFNDGVQNFTNANSALYGNYEASFQVATDAAGQISSYSITLLSPPTPHFVNQTLANLVLNDTETLTVADATCTIVNAIDLCSSINQAAATQSGRYPGKGTWTMVAEAATVASVPALAPVSLVLLALALGGLAVRRGRQQR